MKVLYKFETGILIFDVKLILACMMWLFEN